MTLQPGDHFPDLTLDSLEGPVRLSERWTRQPLVISFMRHFGCAFCREHLIQLARSYEEVRSVGGEVLAVFQYRAEPSNNSAGVAAFPSTVSAAPRAPATRRCGSTVASARSTWACGSTATGSGRREGEVLLAHCNRSSPDNPAIAARVEALKRPTLRPRA